MNSKNLVGDFDDIANAYYNFTPKPPQKYIDLILNTFHVTQNNHILDLGCGSGDIALALSEHASSVTGIDISRTMLSMAMEKDQKKKVYWIHESADNFTFVKNHYDLVFSFEAFHLIPQKELLIQNITKSLKPGGFFCIGWATYEWEALLLHSIREIFNKYGLSWDYSWTCPSLPLLIAQTKPQLSFARQQHISVESSTLLTDIVNYLLFISSTASTTEAIKMKVFEELLEKFKVVYPLGESRGNRYYTIMYFKKESNYKKDKLFHIMKRFGVSFSK